MSSSLSYDAQVRRTAARLDRLPLTTLHWSAIVILGVLYFFDFGDQFVLAYIAPALIKTWHITINDVVLLNAATFLGMAFGAQIGGLIADRFGRKNAIIWITIWIGIFSLLNAAAPGMSVFLLIRFLTGLGLTALTATVSPYITELYPARLRGRIQGWIMVCAFCGTVLVAVLAFLVVPTSAQAWRWLFAYGVVAIIALFFIRSLPESPRWLVLHQRQPQAEAILERLETLALKKVTSLPPLDESSVPPPVTSFSYGQLFQGKYLGRTVLVAALFSLITLSVLGFVNWVPTLLATRGFSLGKTLQISLLIGIAAPIGAGFASWVAERVERKWAIVIYCILAALCGWLYGLSSQPALIVLFGFLVTFFFQGLSPFLFTYAPEVFPTEVRSSAFGFTYGVSRFTNVISPFIIGFFFLRFGYLSVFLYFTVCTLLTALLTALFGPLTNRRSLEQLNPRAIVTGEEEAVAPSARPS
jgi:putative MFS transporter